MDKRIRANLEDLHSEDRQVQHKAFMSIIAATNKPVGWAYDVWDEMVARLGDKNNRERAIAAQVLCNLAKSDPEDRMRQALPALLAVTKDERFVTARHCMQALWKVGVAGKKQRQALVKGLSLRYAECINEKNGTLIRSDILVSLRNLYDSVNDEQVREKALELIETEKNPKYRKKYASLWKLRQVPRSSA